LNQIETNQTLVAQRLRNVAGNDSLRKTFNDGGLADSRFANQNRIVFCAARKHLNRATNFVVTADDGIQFALSSLSQ
jgi:hypothetical protein